MHSVEWASGFFEGEGYSAFNWFLNKQYNRYYARLVLTIAQVYREPLDTFQKVFNLGRVRGPYGPYSTTKQAYFQYEVGGDDAAIVLEQMMPLLFQKAKQATAAIAAYNEYKDRKNNDQQTLAA